ncbi:MAG: hypothetical protein K5656_01830 [Lachnospiraceae bacterium]|nr:hypothetical protein [Lachnospiraceae bacterium]
MTKVIKQKDKYLIFDTFVRDLDVVTQVETTSYINLATEFIDVQDAAEYVKYARNSGYDTSDYTVVDKDQMLADQKAAEENAKDTKLKALWDSSDEEAKRALLSGIKEEEREEFLVKVGDTSGITAYTKEEIAERRIQRLEKTLGIEFTEEQKQILRTKEDF